MSDDRGGHWVKVVVALEQDEDDYPPAAYENLWASPVEAGLYKIDNIPFFAMGIALEDVVSAEPEQGVLLFREVVRPSGHSTIRIFTEDTEQVPAIRAFFAELGCLSEQSHIPGLIALDVPPPVPLELLRQFIADGAEEDAWGYEEACLADSANHPSPGAA
jgi:hypothetical protein